MRYAVFGDIHGNYDALEAAMSQIERAGVDEMLCLGDIVGYGAEPDRCVGKVRELGCLCLAGNHDHAACEKLDVEFFNVHARRAALWTREHLAGEHKEWLSSLGFVEHPGEFALAHGSLYAPELFNYIQTIFDAELSFDALDKPLLFYGHTHVPVAFFDTDPMTYSMDSLIHLDPDVKTLVNIGSVGQPRDENPRACWVLYDSEARTVELRRPGYDVKKAAKKIIDAGLPEVLAYRLTVGQ